MFDYILLLQVSKLIKKYQRNKLLSFDDLKEYEDKKYLLHKAKFFALWSEEISKSANPKISKIFFKVWKYQFLYIGFLFQLEAILNVVACVCIGKIIEFFQDPNTPFIHGIIYLAIVVSLRVFNSIIFSYVAAKAFVLGTSIKYLFQSIIYEKILMSSLETQKNSGNVINLAFSDCQKLEIFLIFGSFIHVSLVQISVIYFVLSYFYVGIIPATCGVLTLFSLVPFQSVLVKKYGNYRKDFLVIFDDLNSFLRDVVEGIRGVKCYSWENAFIERINYKFRSSLHAVLCKIISIDSFFTGYYVGSTCLLSGSIAIALFLIGAKIEASTIFTSISLLSLLRTTIALRLSKGVKAYSEYKVSIERIAEFLLQPQVQRQFSTPKEREVQFMELIDCNFGWNWKQQSEKEDSSSIVSMNANEPLLKSVEDEEERESIFRLRNISIKLDKPGIVLVIGEIGSGKTAFLLSLLGELKLLSGSISINEEISYCSQVPWLLPLSIRENIIMDATFEENRYEEIVELCQLKKDFSVFPGGDAYIVGECGGSLISGGQKARISLARCLYNKNAKIYLLDDIMSALDNEVGNTIFHNIQGFIGNDKLGIIVTHQLHFAKFATEVVIVENGTIKRSQESQFLSQDLISANSVTFSSEIKQQESKASPESANLKFYHDLGTKPTKTMYPLWKLSKNAGGYFLVALLPICCLIAHFLLVATDKWLAFWTSHSNESSHGSYYLIVFIALIITSFTCELSFAIISNNLVLRGLTATYRKMTKSLLKTKMYFFQNNSSGSILNRFVKDQNSLDETFSAIICELIQCICSIFLVVVLVAVINPWILIALPIFTFLVFYYAKCYSGTSKELVKMEIKTRSLLHSLFNDTIEGVTSIRSFKLMPFFLKKYSDQQQLGCNISRAIHLTNRWVALRLDLISFLFFAIALCLMVLMRDNFNGGDVGITIVYILSLIGIVQWCIRQWTEVQNLMLPLQRLIEFTELPGEDEEEQLKDKTLCSLEYWPSQGNIEFRNMSLYYEGRLEPTLQNINIQFRAGEKIGIVGRTGAGKSSFMNALFRFVPANPPSSILIDEIPIDSIPLTRLRSALSMIPQDPFLFRGSLLENLDPLKCYSLEEITKVIDLLELPFQLEFNVDEGGANLSAGEKQLVCLARALLQRSKILLMDEPTANIDSSTAFKIQKVIEEHFKDSTLITIAHRLQTIANYDKILVLSSGSILEFDSPMNLLTNSSIGAFKSLVEELGPSEANKLKEYIMNSTK